MKQKLAILIYSLGGGGAERVLLTLLPILQEHFIIKLFVLEDQNHYETLIPYEVIGSSKSNENAYKKFLKLPILAYLYAKKLKQDNIQLSFSLLNRPNYINLMASKLNPCMIPIISEHATPSQQYKGSSLSAKANRFLIASLYPHAAHIITVSQGVKQDLNDNFNLPQTHITTIYNPFDLENIQTLSKQTSDRLEELQNIAQNRKIWVGIGRLDSGKNHILLIKTMQILKETLKNPPLLLILGEGELKEELQKHINEHQLNDCVSLEGFVKNPYSYIKIAQITLSSSLYEGFLNVLVESLALGIPPISSDCPNGPREILDSKANSYVQDIEITPYGILYPITSSSPLTQEACIDKLAQTLTQIIQGKITFNPETLIQRANLFEYRSIAQSYVHLFQKVNHENQSL